MPPRPRPRASPARVRPALCALDSLRGLRRRRSYPIGRPRPLILAIAMLNAVAAPGKFVANSASRARPQSSPPPSSRASPTRRSSCRPARRPSPLPTSSSACRPHHLGFARSAARADTGTSNVGSSTRVVIAVAVSISSVAINIIVASTSVLGPAGSAHLAPLPSLRSRSPTIRAAVLVVLLCRVALCRAAERLQQPDRKTSNIRHDIRVIRSLI